MKVCCQLALSLSGVDIAILVDAPQVCKRGKVAVIPERVGRCHLSLDVWSSVL
jgi:hypothetical protein